jgi:hypothetical protein
LIRIELLININCEKNSFVLEIRFSFFEAKKKREAPTTTITTNMEKRYMFTFVRVKSSFENTRERESLDNLNEEKCKN